jgi:hypothetical protein
MNVAIFWGLALGSPHANRRFGGKYRLHLQDRKSAEQETSVQQVASHILTTRRCIPEDGNIHSYRRENLQSYNISFMFSSSFPDILERS